MPYTLGKKTGTDRLASEEAGHISDCATHLQYDITAYE